VSGFEDSFEPVRTAAAEGLGTLMKIMGERPMTATMEQLDDIRKTKVKEFAEKAEVKCSAGATSALAKAPAPSKAPIKVLTNNRPVSILIIHFKLSAFADICAASACRTHSRFPHFRQRERAAGLSPQAGFVTAPNTQSS
jgi:hypothetical protein